MFRLQNESKNPDMISWSYRGRLDQDPDRSGYHEHLDVWPLRRSSSHAVRTGLRRKLVVVVVLFVRLWPPFSSCACVCRRWPLLARVTTLSHYVALEWRAFAIGLELGTLALRSLALSARTAAVCQLR